MEEGKQMPTIEEITEWEDAGCITHTIHSAIRFRDERYMFLVDFENFYKFDIQTRKVTPYLGTQNIITTSYRSECPRSIFLR